MARFYMAVGVLLIVVFWVSTADGLGTCKKRCYSRCRVLKRFQRTAYWTCIRMCDQISLNCQTCFGPRRCLKCNSGYSLANQRCVYNLCGTNNGGCAAQATCSAATGIVTCKCKSGYTGNGITCTAIPPTPCQIEAISASAFEALVSPCLNTASISLNSNTVYSESSCNNIGIIMLSVDPLTCTVLNGPLVYETSASVTASSELATELQKSTGTLYVAVTSLCASGANLSPALTALGAACGISALSDIVDVPFSTIFLSQGAGKCASFAFVCEAGYPGKTKFNRVEQLFDDSHASVSAVVTGTGSGMTIV